MEGLPIFVFDKGSVVHDIANHDLKDIENPKYPDHEVKMQKLYDIAYMQWNEEELSNGEALKHILS